MVRSIDANVLATALIGAAADVQERFCRLLPQSAAEKIRKQIESPGPIRLRDVEEARRRLAAAAQRENAGVVATALSRFSQAISPMNPTPHYTMAVVIRAANQRVAPIALLSGRREAREASCGRRHLRFGPSKTPGTPAKRHAAPLVPDGTPIAKLSGPPGCEMLGSSKRPFPVSHVPLTQ